MLQNTCLSSAGEASRYEPRSAEFPTPHVCLQRSAIHNNMSASSQLSVSSHNRASASLQHEQAQVLQTHTANSGLAPQSHRAARSVLKGSVHSSSFNVDLTQRLPVVTIDACQENTFTRAGDEACAVVDNCFHKPSTPPQSWFFIHLFYSTSALQSKCYILLSLSFCLLCISLFFRWEY